MDRISIILKKKEENDSRASSRASSAPALGLNTIIFKHVYWYMQQISGERLQDHWSSCALQYGKWLSRTVYVFHSGTKQKIMFSNRNQCFQIRHP